MAEYAKKGDLAVVEGRLQTRKWEDNDGNTRQQTEIICERCQSTSKGERQAAPALPDEKTNPVEPDDDGLPF